jgi:hypothetical protein
MLVFGMQESHSEFVFDRVIFYCVRTQQSNRDKWDTVKFFSPALQRYLNLYIHRKGIAPRPNFNVHVTVSDQFIPTFGPPIFLQQNRQTDQRNICTNHSQTHECWNWDCSRAIPSLGIFVSNFRCCVFAVCAHNSPI